MTDEGGDTVDMNPKGDGSRGKDRGAVVAASCRPGAELDCCAARSRVDRAILLDTPTSNLERSEVVTSKKTLGALCGWGEAC